MQELRVTSRQNPTLQRVKKLLASRAFREECGLFVAEGTKLLAEAVKWCPELETVVAAEGVTLCPVPERVQVLRVPMQLLQSISQQQAPQGVLFVCRIPEQPKGSVEAGTLVLDGIQDPGNVGTILRTADALQISVVLTEGCADPYNAKTVRASMGAVFRTPPRFLARETLVALCREKEIPLAVTALVPDAEDIRQTKLRSCAVVIGSEGGGVSPELLQAAERKLVIPMNPHCESMNAAVAAAIVLWQMKTE